MSVVGLFNRLMARFGYRLLLIRAIDDERQANARAVEALEQRLKRLGEDHRKLTRDHASLAANHAQLIEARAEEVARLSGELSQTRESLGMSRAAEDRAQQALAAQAAERQAVELELWTRIERLRSRMEAERQSREAVSRKAREDAEVQAEAHNRTMQELWVKLRTERDRVAAARQAKADLRAAVADARKAVAQAQSHVERHRRRLEHEIALREDAEALAAGRGDGNLAMRTARGHRTRNRLDLAVKTLAEGRYLTKRKIDAFYMQTLVELDDNRGLQDAVRASIGRLPPTAMAQDAPYLATICRHASIVCLEPEVIDELLDKTRAAAASSEPLRVLHNSLRIRNDFARAVQGGFEGHATLISLGLNCMPWTLPNRWGLRSPEEFVSLFTPFSYGVHKVRSVLSALLTDFKDYAQVDKLKAVETKGGHLTPMRTDGLAFWNHNLGPYWIENDFARFREGLERKTDNFRAACQAEDAVFILSKAPIDYPAEPLFFLEQLNRGLAKFTGRPNNRILLWNEYAETRERHAVDPWTHVLNCPYPSADYVWYDTSDTDEALVYEQSCAQAVVDSLVEWGMLRARGAAKAPARRRAKAAVG